MKRYASEITNPDNLIIGNTYFMAHKINEQSWVTDIEIHSKPLVCEYTGALYIKTHTYNSILNEYIDNSFFLNDFNIPRNHYNNHCIFSDERDAKQYCND